MRGALVYLFLSASALATPHEFVSGPTRTHLLELFTSEGCSSCPPAEAWLATLRPQPGLWRQFVPIAWHVDYWDRLGWKDRFASKSNTARQYAYAEAWHSASVYTPCFALNGQEWRDRSWPSASRESVGELRAIFDAGKVTVRFAPTPGKDNRPRTYEAHATLLAMGVTSRVTAGENSGRNLQHHFVAALPAQNAPLKNGEAQFELPPVNDPGPTALALAVWITAPAEPTPIQATGGPLGPP